mmetsp:Transcript_36005/g.57520  ORF Transcript_36005/g.57520 Transcript_36005/m.57520 type:complete len:967 (+) Transcript_36005:90-2990(+)
MLLTLSFFHIAICANGAAIPLLGDSDEKSRLRIDAQHRSIGLRGGISSSRSHQDLVALQVAATLHKRQTIAAESSKLSREVRHQQRLALRESQYAMDRCRGRKLLWWVEMRKKCRAAFGDKSSWDGDLMQGQCKRAWNHCQQSYYTGCCTQTAGPKTMDAYCDQLESAKENSEKNETDKACKVEGLMKGVKTQVKKITLLVKKIDLADASNETVPRDKDIDALTLAPAAAPASSSESDGDHSPNFRSGTPESDRILKQAAPRVQMPSSIAPLSARSVADGSIISSGFSPAPAPMYVIAASPASISEPVPLARRCKQLTDLTKNLAKRLSLVKKWAVGDGMRDLNHEQKSVEKMSHPAEAIDDPEASDPDLTFSLKSVLKLGTQLDVMLADSSFCTKVVQDDAEDKEDEEEEEESDDADGDEDKDKRRKEDEDSDVKDKKKRARSRLREDTDDEDEEGDENIAIKEQRVVEANVTAIIKLLEFDNELQLAVDDFETQVHPHGVKWWRYRYEYTIIESFVLAYTVLILFIIKAFVFGPSFFQVHRFYRTGIQAKLYQYAFVYFVFQAACVWIMVLTAYVLYMPWGENNIFNVCAKALHQFVGDAFRVPYLGSSWLFLILDVQFQLFATYCLYSGFVCMVARTYTRALQDWKDLDNGSEAQSVSNKALYDKFSQILIMRVQTSKSYLDLFRQSKLRLAGVKELADEEKKDSARMSGVSGEQEESDEELSDQSEQWFDFKLHLYLTEGLGKSMEYLVQVSLTTNLWLAVCAIVVAIFAHLYQLAFMYLLPPFVVISVVILVSGYILSRHYVGLSEDPEHDLESKFVTVHNYCRAIQIILYCMFYSFARLLLSTDIFEHYPSVYLSALLVLVLVLVTLAVCGGPVMKEATCALILPPHISNEQFAGNLAAIKRWHTIVNCHQCGVSQKKKEESYSIGWAGEQQISSARPSARNYSSMYDRKYSYPAYKSDV